MGQEQANTHKEQGSKRQPPSKSIVVSCMVGIDSTKGLVTLVVVSMCGITVDLVVIRLGANAYSFVRAFSFILSAVGAMVVFGTRPTVNFWIGAAIVMVAGEQFSKAAAPEQAMELPADERESGGGAKQAAVAAREPLLNTDFMLPGSE